jgi:hypothetical protein
MRTDFLGVGVMAKSANVTSQTRKNMYLDMQPAGQDKIRVSAHPTPGLDSFLDFGETPVRGIYEKDNLLYIVHRNTLWEANNAGTTTNRGTLDTSSGRVSIIDNGTEINIVDGEFGYIYTIATTTLTKITDGDYSTSPQTTTFNDGYFIYSQSMSGQFAISSLYAGLTYSATDFATAESNPDNLVRVEEDSGNIVLFGEDTTEFWANTGELDFPYSRIAGTDMEWGLAARWSVAKFKNSLMFLGKSREGEVRVIHLNGYNPVPVSHSDLESIFNSAATSNASAFSYMVNGHSMYQITFPNVGRTFVYDATSEVWHEMTSGGGRHRAEMGVNFIDTKVVTDYENGKVYRFNKDTRTDNGTTIIREITGRHYETDMDDFTVKQFHLDAEIGVGLETGQGSDPQVMMQYSTDGGHKWSEELWTTLGKIGEFAARAEWWQLGKGRNFTIRVRVSDPVKFVCTGAGLKVAA